MGGHQPPSVVLQDDLQAMLDAGRAGEVADELVELSWSSRRDDEAERIVVALLALGRLGQVCAALGALGSDAPLLVRLLRADGAVRTSPGADVDLTALSFGLVRSEAPSSWSLWYAAIVAEQLGLDGGVQLDAVASVALHSTCADPSPLATLALGRLKRAVGISALVSPATEDHTRGLGRLCAAQADFAAAGSYEECTWTTALRVYVQAALRERDPAEATGALQRLAARLTLLGSDRADAAHRLTLAAAISCRDRARAVEALHVPAGSEDEAGHYPRQAHRALVALLTDAPDRDAFMALSAADADTFEWPLAQQAATLLLDLGAAEMAAAILPGAVEHPGDPDEIEAGIRCRLQTGDPGAFADLADFAARWDAGGRASRAALAELRGARDCDVVNRPTHAETLRRRARRRDRRGRILGPGRLATRYDTGWQAPPRPTVAGACQNEVLTLQGDVQLNRHGEAVHLTPRMARMLALMVAARRPLTTDVMLEALWPDTAPDVGANRLKVLVHRLRTRVGLAPGELLIRDRAGFALSTDGGWRIDAWDFWMWASGTTEEQIAALDIYGTDFCAAAGYDDEGIATERDSLRARWIDLAHGLVSSGAADIPRVAPRAETLGIDIARLVAGSIAS